MTEVVQLNEWLTEEEVAERLRISLATMQRIRRRGEIRYKRIGRSIRYRHDWVFEYEERDTCPEMKGPASSANTGSRSDPAPKTGIAPGMNAPLPAIGAQDAKASALQALKKQN